MQEEQQLTYRQRYRIENREKQRQRQRDYYRKNKEQHRIRTKSFWLQHKDYFVKLVDGRPWIAAYRSSRSRAKKRGIPFNLDKEYLKSIWTDTCPILGIRFVQGRRGERAGLDNSPSLDRIDPAAGYIKGNVCFISNRANCIKNCGSIEEHKKIIEYMERTQPSPPAKT